MARAGFVQAGIAIQDPERFARLRQALDAVLAPAAVEKFLRRVKGHSLRVRQFEAVLARRIVEALGALPDGSAEEIYASLPMSDQAQMREFYLTRIEQIAPQLRQRFHTQFETF